MNLLETYDSLLEDWRNVFSQNRTFERARRLTFGLLVCLRLHLTSRAICAIGRQFVDWSADYRLCSRSPWIRIVSSIRFLTAWPACWLPRRLR